MNKLKEPKDTPFKQQRLKSWQPILSAGNVYIYFFLMGIASIPIGISLLHISNKVTEVVIDYTFCNGSIQESNSTNVPCHEHVNRNSSCICKISFTLEKDILGTVFMYYGLSNYYQNHRRYVQSQDEYQSLGILGRDISDCTPFDKNFDENSQAQLPVVPCGAIANSMFNDTLTLYQVVNSSVRVLIPLLKTGIAWNFDKNIKFRNPDNPNGLEKAFEGFTKPRNWRKYVWELDPDDPSNNGLQNEDLMIWMRTSALPTFKKLYRAINNEDPLFKNGLLKGNYELLVDYAYDVVSFDGNKQMILTNTSILGTKNSFLGFAFIVAGSIWLILGSGFLFLHIKYEKRLSLIGTINPRSYWSRR